MLLLNIYREELKGFWLARRYPRFLLIDLALKFLGNPYRLCSRWLKKQGASEIYVYGETPIATFAKIAEKVDLRGKNFIDLGSGRGRLVFWAMYVLSCKSHGIEQVPGLVKRAGLFAKCFSCKAINAVDLSDADVVYLASTCMDAETYEPALQTMRPGATLVTVSSPVAKGFTVQEMLELPFHFGSAEVFIHSRNDELPLPEAGQTSAQSLVQSFD